MSGETPRAAPPASPVGARHDSAPATVMGSFFATWRAMLGDAGALMLLFVGGIVYAFFYPLPYAHETVQRVPVVVVDQDRSALSRQIVRYVQAHPALALHSVVPEPADAQDLLWRQQVAGALVIPAGLNRQVLAGQPAEVALAGSGAYLLMNKVAVNALAEVVGTVSAGVEVKRLMTATPAPAQAMAQRQPLVLDAVPLFNTREGYGAYLVPGVAVLILQQTLWMAVALMMGGWAERGRWPAPPTLAGYTGALLAFACVPLLNCAWWFGAVLWWHDYPRGGSPAALAGFAGLFSLTLAASALWLGSAFRTRERGAQVLLGASMPLLFISGLPWPAQALPPLLQALRWASPSTAGIEGFVAINQLGASWQEVRVEVAVLAALGVVSLAGGLWCWRRR